MCVSAARQHIYNWVQFGSVPRSKAILLILLACDGDSQVGLYLSQLRAKLRLRRRVRFGHVQLHHRLEFRQQLPPRRLVSSHSLPKRNQPLVKLQHPCAELTLGGEGAKDGLHDCLRREQLAERTPPLSMIAEAGVGLECFFAALCAETVFELGDEGVGVVE